MCVCGEFKTGVCRGVYGQMGQKYSEEQCKEGTGTQHGMVCVCSVWCMWQRAGVLMCVCKCAKHNKCACGV